MNPDKDSLSQLYSLDDSRFTEAAMEEFKGHFIENRVYREYCERIGRTAPQNLRDIPFLPIEFFKTQRVMRGSWEAEAVFISSGTGSVGRSEVYVRSMNDYRKISTKIFRNFYGDPSDYVILALLPGYLEQGNSSLVKMVDGLIEDGGDELSGFFLNQYEEILGRYKKGLEKGKKVILWGVSFALLEFAKVIGEPMDQAIVIETGGMKGRGKEIVRDELHDILKRELGTRTVHSEYGMSELMSQAYSVEKGVFQTPPWMKIMIREVNDPLSCSDGVAVGGINIIDLASHNTCPFIATQDMGKLLKNGHFEVTGRLDNSDIRGCNLMII